MAVSRLAVLGSPIAHSLSPAIHRRFAEQLGHEIDYRALEVPAQRLLAFLYGPDGSALHGVNLTLPLKELGLAVADELDDTARRSGAVNTLVRLADGRWAGHNTDAEGLARDLRRLGFQTQGRRIAVLGAGGAARAAVCMLLDAGAEVILCNRNVERAFALTDAFGRPEALTVAREAHQEVHGIINATSAGYAGANAAAPWQFVGAAFAYDLSYGEAAQPFLASYADTDIPVADGLGMLVEQAALAFALWFGEEPSTTQVLSELRRLT